RPVAAPDTAGAWYRRWRLVAVDGTVFDVPDTEANASFFGRPGSGRGQRRSAYPQVRVAALAVGAVVGAAATTAAPCPGAGAVEAGAGLPWNASSTPVRSGGGAASLSATVATVARAERAGTMMGAAGAAGESSHVLTNGHLVNAVPGAPGAGGDASSATVSGSSSSGGKGGTAAKFLCSGGKEVKMTPGNTGRSSDAASRNSPTAGAPGAPGPLALATCYDAGGAGDGGRGAGNYADGGHGEQRASEPGTKGDPGCVVLTYTVKATTA
ncbi:hypothetical protein ACIO94_35380, partial [Streptomyces sp. NPDC087298]